MPIATILGGALGALFNGWQNRQMMDEYYQNEAMKAQYNSIGNQLQQWKTAGLNPNSFNGNFQPVTGTPPQPQNIGDSLARSLSSAGSLWQQKQIAKMNNEVQLQRLNLDKEELKIKQGDAKMRSDMHEWSIKLAKQAFQRGDYALAMDILDYTYAFSTHDKRVQQFKDEASITHEYAKRYPSYLSALINNYLERNRSLRHSRMINDKRLVFDWNKHYDDMNFSYYKSAQDEQQFNKNFGLRSSQASETRDYHNRYLDYLYARRDIAIRDQNWRQVRELNGLIQNTNFKFKIPNFSPKFVY